MTQEPSFKRLQQLKDIDLSSLSDSQYLKYNSTSGKWENVFTTPVELTSYNFTGADCTGTNPDKILDCGHESAKMIILERSVLHPSLDFSQIGTVITFINIPIINIMKITVYV